MNEREAVRHGEGHRGNFLYCPICGEGFIREDRLDKHEQAHESRSNEAPSITGEMQPGQDEAQQAVSETGDVFENFMVLD